MLEENKKILLKVVRQAVEAAVLGESYSPEHTDNPELLAPLGCFVTLKTDGRLRGCIGTFVFDKPLIQTAAEMAHSAVLHDYRFADDTITKNELKNLQIEVSVLSELQKTDDPLSLELGLHGIYITKGSRSGCFLPQVATETGWTKEEFLSYCCSHKAGLARNAWKEPDTTVYLFTAEVIE